MDEYKYGMIDVMFPIVENLCEIITVYANVINKLALVVYIDVENKVVDIKPFVFGEDEPPNGGANISPFGDDIYKCRMPQEALLIYFYDAIQMVIREKERCESQK